ncbi:MAG: hypothetical protein COA40_07320 [Aequorivita sp.]|nr:MAG: hypothetical protein COA40_07320 [Aequorivita sp.]
MFKLPIKLIELEFVKIEFYEHYMISTFIEGMTLNNEDVGKIQELSAQFYQNKPFGYISNRINDYSRNLSPNSYNIQLPNLFAFAIVYKSETSRKVANFEKFFIKAPFKTFQSLSQAKQWMGEMAENLQ